MNTVELIQDLQRHRDLCHEALAMFNAPDRGDANQIAARKTLPARLEMSLISLRRWRHWWRDLSAAKRREQPEVQALLQDTLDLMMKSIVQGREAIQDASASPAPAPPVAARPVPVDSPPPSPRPSHFVARRYIQHAD